MGAIIGIIVAILAIWLLVAVVKVAFKLALIAGVVIAGLFIFGEVRKRIGGPRCLPHHGRFDHGALLAVGGGWLMPLLRHRRPARPRVAAGIAAALIAISMSGW